MQDLIGPHVTKTLRDGTEYTFSRIGLNMLCEFGQQLNRWNGKTPTSVLSMDETLAGSQSLQGLRWLLWRSLREHHPKITEAQVGNLFQVSEELGAVFNELLDMPEVDTATANPQEESA